MLLSVIVPVYNTAGEGKLEYCLNSLVSQTLEDMEIIAVDDCSTDDSWQILQRFEREYPGRFRAVHSEVNRKQGGAKNIGLSLARGEWIGFIDSDDWITPDMYEKLLACAGQTGADMVGCDYCLTDEHSMKAGQTVHNNRPEQTGILNHEKYASLILDSGSLVVKIYRREIILGCGSRFPEGIFYEDNALGNTWMLRAKHFEYIPEPMYYYYQHDASTVHTITKKRCEDRMQAGRIMIDEAKKYGYFEEYYRELEYSFTVLFYVNTLFSYMLGVKRKDPAFVKAMGREMRETFPDFQKNPWYQERFNEEEKRLVDMQQRSTMRFMLYFTLLWTWRGLRKKLAGVLKGRKHNA